MSDAVVDMGYTVRAATRHDLPQLLAFSAGYAEAPPWTAAAWEPLLLSSEGELRRYRVLLLQTQAGELVGWVAGHVLDLTAELEFLLVHPARRSLGLGRFLLERWLGWAREAGAAEVLLEVRASNTAAERLYAALGFTRTGRRARYYRAPLEDALCMRLHWPHAVACSL